MILTIVTAGAGGAVTAAPAFHLVFDGKHNENLWHEGSFTSSAAFCPSGYAADIDVDDTTLTAVRRFTCSGGGDFTARLGSLRAEHGGTGNWTIMGGSGPLADLRGMGTFTSVRLNGNQDDPASITFRSTWDGFAAFDVLAPTVSIASASIRKLARPSGAWRVVALVAVDDAEGATSWRLVVSDRRKPLLPLASKTGESANGTIRIVIKLRVPKGVRTLRLQADGTDAVGNHASSVKPLRLP
jgi:hypothetical protein